MALTSLAGKTKGSCNASFSFVIISLDFPPRKCNLLSSPSGFHSRETFYMLRTNSQYDPIDVDNNLLP